MSAVTQFAVTQLRDLLICRTCQRPIDSVIRVPAWNQDKSDFELLCHGVRETLTLTGLEMLTAQRPAGVLIELRSGKVHKLEAGVQAVLELIYQKSSLLGDGPTPTRGLLLAEDPYVDPTKT